MAVKLHSGYRNVFAVFAYHHYHNVWETFETHPNNTTSITGSMDAIGCLKGSRNAQETI